jgi:hypothetical protein
MRISLSARVHCTAPALCSVVTLAAMSLLWPASAGAYATPGPAPVPGSPGLPDGRIYELVSPANKPGTQAAPDVQGAGTPIWAASDGNSAAFFSSGSIGDAPSGVEQWTVAKRSAGSWQSAGAIPRPLGAFTDVLETDTTAIGFSADFTKSIFTTDSSYVPNQPGGPLKHEANVGNIYNLNSGSPVWLAEPLVSNSPGHFPGYESEEGRIAGISPDLSTVYFSYQGGYYEWHEGQVSPAGVLPDGSIDPYGARPAGYDTFGDFTNQGDARNQESAQNEVSEDGSRAFFVSPNPGTGYPVGDPPELYVRETATDGTQSTVLVSRDTLLPPVNGLLAGAPDGPLPFTSANTDVTAKPNSYVWATPNGARAFFLSADQLTAEAPADDSSKLYEFNLETNTLTYLSGATSPTTGAAVLAASQDGSRLLFAKLAENKKIVGNDNNTLPVELDLWTDGPEGASDGRVTPIAPLDSPGSAPEADFLTTRAASDGSSFVFETREAFAGFNFSNNGFNVNGRRNTQVYRYEVAANSLTCLSCAPAGVVHSGDAQLESEPRGEVLASFNKDRGISEAGDRVFFDTPDALVPWDSNTEPPANEGGNVLPRGYDVYEWENGKLFLISTGKSSKGAFVGDNSANGNNVFFATAEGVVPADTDGGYDVYDARIPEPGETPASVVPCEGEVCQGPPTTPLPLGLPASATFSGLGNPAPGVPAPATNPVAPKSLTTAQKLSAALKACGKQPKRERARCKAQAKKKYAPRAKKSNGGGR